MTFQKMQTSIVQATLIKKRPVNYITRILLGLSLRVILFDLQFAREASTHHHDLMQKLRPEPTPVSV